MTELRYLSDEKKFLEYAFKVLGKNYFHAKNDEFLRFYNAINDDNKKNEFLKIVSFLKILIIDGDFISKIDGSEKKSSTLIILTNLLH